MIIKNAKIHNMIDQNEFIGDIKINKEFIEKVDKNIKSLNSDEKVIDLNGLDIYPGFIDAHNHLGIIEDSLCSEGDDVNEISDPITPHLRVIDAINPNDRCFKEALDAGVTTVIVSPGSTNPIAGNISAIKTFGNRIDDMLIKSSIGIKFSMGENPKKAHHKDAIATRMSIAALIRETLAKAKKYNPNERYDIKLEALLPLISKKSIAFFHAHRSDDIFTSIRIAKEFNLKYVIIHATDGHLITDELKQEKASVLSGPFIMGRTKPELKNLTPASPAIMNDKGITTAIISDHPEFPCNYLPLCAYVAYQEGMSEFEAIKAITSNPAKICEIDNLVGTIEPGKYANLIAFNGSPLINKPKLIITEGKLYKDNRYTSPN